MKENREPRCENKENLQSTTKSRLVAKRIMVSLFKNVDDLNSELKELFE